ncbi:bacteriohemerythrin [Magnetospirillum sp. SS-4]|uniref:bacteriohemerythrin n=1 Tax=Magnetospirillum sp. SS-4 TaxID=2681465 RepID=UPI00137D108B|nr:hemerythrin family protein [Magnetospirillum sp. SS-4]CAA7625194.1 Hemerythrin-like metal-binding protein [Magnetospirillum sp. SS-4]
MTIGWRDEYAIGHSEIDQDHRSLMDALAVLSSGYCEADLVDTQIKLLERYTIEHFAREEQLMRGIGYPDIDAHLALHDQFRDSVRRLRAQWAAGYTPELQAEIAAELSHWLEKHILAADHDYGAWLRK